MKIFVLNNGSSSMKCSLYDFKNLPSELQVPIWQAHAQWGSAIEQPFVRVQKGQNEPYKKSLSSLSCTDILKEVLTTLSPEEILAIDVIGHRIVHGGREYTKSAYVTEAVKATIAHLGELAPLHNAADLEGIMAFEKILPNVPQVAVFDTSFHHTLPLAAKLYPGPYAWYEEGICRYGFHGTSFQYCSRKVGAAHRMVICHLGSGASLCAVRDGKSIDTTMGFTPLDGLMMDTRSGSVDPGILLYVLKQNTVTPENLYEQLYRKSGLLGISGSTSDMRDIIEMSQHNERARLAFDMYIHRLVSLVGSMIASLQGLDVLVFTAGIGENASLVRQKVCESLSFLGLKLDQVKNDMPHKEDCDLSGKGSTIKVLLIHTQEAFEIARECWLVTKSISATDRPSS